MAKDFQNALESELSLLINLPVYRDEERLRAGQFFNKALAKALCQSACMVAIYIPRYFELGSPYCAREFKAMEQLESQRLAKLRRIGISNPNGFIIPIAYRGHDFLPKHIKDKRQCYNFEPYFLGGKTQKNNKNYLLAMKNIANYIFQRCQDLNRLPADPYGNCDKFVIPSKSQISGWLKTMACPPPNFPGRKT